MMNVPFLFQMSLTHLKKNYDVLQDDGVKHIFEDQISGKSNELANNFETNDEWRRSVNNLILIIISLLNIYFMKSQYIRDSSFGDFSVTNSLSNSSIFNIVNLLHYRFRKTLFVRFANYFLTNIYKITLSFIVRINILYKNSRLNVEQVSSSSDIKLLLKLLAGNNLQFVPIQLVILGVMFIKSFEKVIRYENNPSFINTEDITKKHISYKVMFIKFSKLKSCTKNIFENIPDINGRKIESNENVKYVQSAENVNQKNTESCMRRTENLQAEDFKNVLNKIVYPTDYLKLFKTLWNVFDRGKFFITYFINVCKLYKDLNDVQKINNSNSLITPSDSCKNLDVLKLQMSVNNYKTYTSSNVSQQLVIINALLVISFTLIYTMLMNIKTLRFFMNFITMSQMSINTCANFTNQKAGCAYSSSSDASECSTPRISRNAKKAGQNSRSSEIYAKLPGSASDLTLNVPTPLGKKKQYESGDLGSKSNLDEDSDDYYGETKSKLKNYQVNPDISKNIPGRKPKQRKKTSKEGSSRYDRGEYIITKDDKDRSDSILHKGKTTTDRSNKNPIAPKYLEKGKKRTEKKATSSEYTLDAYSTESNCDDTYQVLQKAPLNKNQNKNNKSPINSRRANKEKILSRSENAKVIEDVKRPLKSTRVEKYRPFGPDKRAFSTLYTNKNVCEGSSLEAIPEPYFNKIKYKANAPTPKKKLPSKYLQEYISTDESEFTEEDLENDSHNIQDKFYESSAEDIHKKQNHRNKKQKCLDLQILPEAGKKRKPERKSTREFVSDKRKRVSSTQNIDKTKFGNISNAKKDVNYFKSKPNPPKYNLVRQKRKFIDIKSDQKQKTCDCTPAKRNKITCKTDQSLAMSVQCSYRQNVKNLITQTSARNQKVNIEPNQGHNVLFNYIVSNSPKAVNPFNESKSSFSKGREKNTILPKELQESMNTILQRLETKLGRVYPERQDVCFNGNEKTTPSPGPMVMKKSGEVTNDVKKFTNQNAINSYMFQPISVFSDSINTSHSVRQATSKQCYQKSNDINYKKSSVLPFNEFDNSNKCNNISLVKKRSISNIEFPNTPIKISQFCIDPTLSKNNTIISGTEKPVSNQENNITSKIQHCEATIPEIEYFVFKDEELLLESINSENTSPGPKINKKQHDHQNLKEVDCQQDSTILQLITDVMDTKNISTSSKANSSEKNKINEFIKCAVDIFKILEKRKGNDKADSISDKIKDFLNDTLQNIGNTINKPIAGEAPKRNIPAHNNPSPFDKNILVYNQVTSKNIVNLRNQEIQTAFPNCTKNVRNKKSDNTDIKYNANSNVIVEHNQIENVEVCQSYSPSNYTTSTCKTCRTTVVNSKPRSDEGTNICHVCTKKIHPRNVVNGADIAKECAVQCFKNTQSNVCLHNPICEHKPKTVSDRKTHSVSSLSTGVSYLNIRCPTNTDLSCCPYYPDGECSSKCNVCNIILKHNMKCTSFSSSDINHAQHNLSRFDMDFTDDSEVNVLYHLGKYPKCQRCKFNGTRNQYKNRKCFPHKVEDTVSIRSCKFKKLAMNIAVGCNLEKHSANKLSNENMEFLNMACSTHNYYSPSENNSLLSRRYVPRNTLKEFSDDKSEKKHDKLKHLTAVNRENDLLQVLPCKSKMKKVPSQSTVAGTMIKDDVYSKVKKVCRDTIQKGFQKYSKQYKSSFGKPKVKNQKSLAAPIDQPVLKQSMVSSKFGTVVVSKGSYPRDSDTYILTNNETSGDDISPPVPKRPYTMLPRVVQGKYSRNPPPLPTRKYCLINPANKTENIAENNISHRDKKEVKSNTTFIRDVTTSDTKEMSGDEESYVPRETVFYYTSKKGSQCFMGDVLQKKAIEKPRKELKDNKTHDCHVGTNSSLTKSKICNKFPAKKHKNFEEDSLRYSIEKKIDSHSSNVRENNNTDMRKVSNLNKSTIENDVEAHRLPSKYVRKSKSDFKMSCTNKCEKYTENPIKCKPQERNLEIKQTNVLSTSKLLKGGDKSVKVSNFSSQNKKAPLESYKSHSCSMVTYQRKDCKDRIVQTELSEKDIELEFSGNVEATNKIDEFTREKNPKVKKDQQLDKTNCSSNIKRFLGNHNVLSTATNAMCIRSVNEVYFQVPRSNADDRPFSESISIEETEDGSENILLFGDIAVIPKIDKNIEIYFKNTTHLDGMDTFEINTDNRKNITDIYSNEAHTESCTEKNTCHDLQEFTCSELKSMKIPEKNILNDIAKEQSKFSHLDNTDVHPEFESLKPEEMKKLENNNRNLVKLASEHATLQESLVQKIAEVEPVPNITPLDSFEDDLYIQSILQECLQKQKCENSGNRYLSSDNEFNDDISHGRQRIENNKSALSNTVSVSKIETCVNVYDYEDSKIDSVLLEAKKLAAYRENLNKRTTYLTSGKYIQNQKEFANMIEEISDCLLPSKVDDYFILTDPFITEPLDMLGKYKLKEDSIPDKSIKKYSDNSSILSQPQNLSLSGSCRSNKDSYYWGDLIENESEILEPIGNKNVSDNSGLDLMYIESQSFDRLNLAEGYCNKRQELTRQNTIDVKYSKDITKHHKYGSKEIIMKKNYDALWEQFKDVLQVFRYVEKQSQESQLNTPTSNETLEDVNIATDSNHSIQKLMLDLISSNQFTRIGENVLMERTKKYNADIPKLHEEINSSTVDEEIVEESNVMSEQQLKLTLNKLETMKERLMKLKGSILVRESEYYDESESSDIALRDSTGNFDTLQTHNYDDTSNSKPASSTTCKQNEIDEDLRNSCWTRENATQHFINTKLYKTIMKKNSFLDINVSFSKSSTDVLHKIKNTSTTGSETDELGITDDSNINILADDTPCYPVNYHTVSYQCKEGIPTKTYKFKHKSNRHFVKGRQSISSVKSDNTFRAHRKDKRKHPSNWESLHTLNCHSIRDRRFKKQEVFSKTSKSEPSISASGANFKGWSTKSDRRCSDRSFASSSNRYDMCLKDNCLDVGKYAEIGGKIANEKCNSSDFASSVISTTQDSCKISVGLHMEDDCNKGLFW